MPQTVVILGAKGRFGRAATSAFYAAGWRVRTFTRNSVPGELASDIETHLGDAFDSAAVTQAAEGCDVIVNALHPPYHTWARDLPRLSRAVITAAKASGASIMLPGNIYNYGADMPAVLTEDTPHQPTTRKGELRETLEETYAIAADEGVQTLILRAGDFIERQATGNWFETHITPKADRGIITYPGPHDRMHAWAYLPDLARATVMLVEARAQLGPFATFGFEGFNLTGEALIAAIAKAYGHEMRVKSMPWSIMRLLGLVVPTIREVMEMRYLWQVPHAIDGAALRALIPAYRATPLETALQDVLPGLTNPASANVNRPDLTIAHV